MVKRSKTTRQIEADNVFLETHAFELAKILIDKTNRYCDSIRDQMPAELENSVRIYGAAFYAAIIMRMMEPTSKHPEYTERVFNLSLARIFRETADLVQRPPVNDKGETIQ